MAKKGYQQDLEGRKETKLLPLGRLWYTDTMINWGKFTVFPPACIRAEQCPLEEEMVTHSSILAWEIPWTEKPGGATVHDVTKESDMN